MCVYMLFNTNAACTEYLRLKPEFPRTPTRLIAYTKLTRVTPHEYDETDADTIKIDLLRLYATSQLLHS